jgi:hypothetical protein
MMLCLRDIARSLRHLSESVMQVCLNAGNLAIHVNRFQTLQRPFVFAVHGFDIRQLHLQVDAAIAALGQ